MTHCGITTIVSALAYTALNELLARQTQSTLNESQMALAEITAYTWNMLNNTGGHAQGNEEAEAEMMPELRAIFKMTTSTALAYQHISSSSHGQAIIGIKELLPLAGIF